MRVYPLLVLFALGILAVGPVRAQDQCGYAQSITYPIDTNVFRLSQDFGAPSPRHQGRYHTGEDWFGGRADHYGLGMPVRAAANGRVTYSAPTGWGRDGGVVIVEHTFPDGTVAYSHYGHMMETDSVRFPAPYSCVQAGEIIGAVGDVRPAPHLHFEIRVSSGSSPGAGYTWENPVESGWRRPAKFILNIQARVLPAYRWHLDLRDEAGPTVPPLELEDGSLLYLDSQRLGRVSPDGRSLWRISLEQPAAGLARPDGKPALIYKNGMVQLVNLDGTLAERWATGQALDALTAASSDLLIFRTSGGSLVAFDSLLERELWAWEQDSIPSIARSAASPRLISLITGRDELVTFQPQGQLVDRAQLRELASLTNMPDGQLLAYTVSGLWSIGFDGQWTLALENAPSGSSSSAVLLTPSNQLYLFDGRVLHAYGANWTQTSMPLWQVEIPDVSGRVELSGYGQILLITSSHGHVVALRAADGALCSRTRIFGDERAHAWHSLGADGILRLAVADQIMGLNWRTFLSGCAG